MMQQAVPVRDARGLTPRRRPLRAAVLLVALLGGACATAPDPGGRNASAAAAAGPTVPGAAGARTVIVTRHAERADDGTSRDPELSPVGRARAAALADALADAGVSAVLTTQFTRTRGTAAPLAERLGLRAEVIEVGSGATAEHIGALRSAVLARPAGSVILVVGHSNTVPLLVRELSGRAVPDMPESEYGTLYILTIPADGSAVRVIRAYYPVPAT